MWPEISGNVFTFCWLYSLFCNGFRQHYPTIICSQRLTKLQSLENRSCKIWILSAIVHLTFQDLSLRQKSNIHPSLWNTKRNAVELPSHHPPEALSTIIFPHPLMISMPKVVAVFQVALADLLWASVCGFWKGGQPTDGLFFTQWVITSNSVARCQTDSTCIAHRQQIITTDSVLIRWISVSQYVHILCTTC